MSNRLDRSIFGEDPEATAGSEAPGAGSTRASRRAVRSRPPLWRRFVVIAIALAVIGGGAFAAYTVLRPVVAGFMESDDYAGPGTGQVRITVADGDTGSAIAKKLVAADVVKTQKAYNEAAAANEKSVGIQPGVYELKTQMTAAQAVAVLVDPSNRIVKSVTIPEGLWTVEILPRLSKATGIPLAEYQKAIKDTKAIGLPAAAKGNVEGYLFPATYEFDPESTATDQLAAMVANSTKRITALGVKPENMERLVIIASIIEGEARHAEDMAKVSRVIYNRLTKNMTLGMDSTVNYMFKKRGVPTLDMLQKDDPYNTRIRAGLPPGPISNPGEAAITAAAKPTPGDWLYFTTVNLDTGETKFTASDAEHQANAAQFTKWCTDNPGKC